MAWQQQGQMPQVEAQLGEQANLIYEGLLDLNTPRNELQQAWTKLMSVRDRLLGMYGVTVVNPPAPLQPAAAKGNTKGAGNAKGQGVWQDKGKGKGKKAPVAAVSAPIDQEGSDFKSKLLHLIVVRAGSGPPSKGTLVFESSEAPGGYLATLSSEHLQGMYSSQTPEASKKLAEQAAAKAALMAEFPQELTKSGGVSTPVNKGAGKGGAKGAPAQGVKRKAPGTEEVNPKSKLGESVTLLIGRSIAKGDMEFQTVAIEEGNPNTQFVSSAALPTYDSSQVWEGAPGATKKDAESNAATVVLEALAEVIAVAAEEHREKKARKDEEKRAELALKKQAQEQQGLA